MQLETVWSRLIEDDGKPYVQYMGRWELRIGDDNFEITEPQAMAVKQAINEGGLFVDFGEIVIQVSRVTYLRRLEASRREYDTFAVSQFKQMQFAGELADEYGESKRLTS